MRWNPGDSRIVVESVQAAARDPVTRAVDPRKLQRRPKGTRSPLGIVAVPESDSEGSEEAPEALSEGGAGGTVHTEIQGLLLKLGSEMGLDVWVARNDRTRQVAADRFGGSLRIRTTLPLQFDEATNRTIELIDVLWLKGHQIVAAFEVESTTSIYSGLLRMADLVSMQPNLKIPLFLVAPEERRNKVLTEVNRPTFARLVPPLDSICRYISFETLRREVQEAARFLSFVKPEWIFQISEACDLP